MFYSIRTQLLFLIIVLIVPFVIMGYLFWQQAASAIRESIESSTVQTLSQYADFVDGTASQVMNAANQILRNEATQDWIHSRSEPDAVDQLLQNMKMRKYFDSVVSSTPVIFTLNIFYEAWDLWNLDGDEYTTSEWYQHYRQFDKRWHAAHYDNRQNGTVQNNTLVSSLVYPLSDLKNLKEIGILKMNIRAATLQEPLEKLRLGTTGKAHLMTMDGRPVLNTIPDGLSGTLLERICAEAGDDDRIYRDGASRMIYFCQPVRTTGWAVVGTVSEAELFQKISAARRSVLIVAGMLAIVTVALAFWFSSSLVTPITRVVRSMRFVEAGDFLKGQAAMSKIRTAHSEIGYLTANYQNMVDRLQSYIKTEYAQNLRRRNAEYKALLLQINPHFLNNTLEVISSLAAQGRTHDIDQVIHNLSMMLRFTLNVGQERIRVRDEIRHIHAFISILNICYGDRVEFKLRNNLKRDDQLIPKLLVQPLIENAVKYSLDKKEIAVIEIAVEERSEQLIFQIRDNGIGIPEETLRDLLRDAGLDFAQDVLEMGEKGVGLKNVMARGRLFYGAQFQFDIASVPGEGTSITMILPSKE